MNKKVFFLPLFLIFLGCDFAPRTHRDILRAQNNLIQQNFIAAINLYEKILTRINNDELKVKIYFQLGEIYSLNLGEYSKAVEHYLLAQEFSNDILWIIRAEEKIADIRFTFLKDFENSIANYTFLSSFTPRLSDYNLYQYRIAKSYYWISQYDESKKIFLEITNDQENDFSTLALFELGLIYFEMKEWNTALSYWGRYLRREGDNDRQVLAKFLMANTLERQEELKKAYDIYYSILTDYPNTEVIKKRLNGIISRRIARKR